MGSFPCGCLFFTWKEAKEAARHVSPGVIKHFPAEECASVPRVWTWAEGTGKLCPKYPGQAKPLINRHILHPREWPGN